MLAWYSKSSTKINSSGQKIVNFGTTSVLRRSWIYSSRKVELHLIYGSFKLVVLYIHVCHNFKAAQMSLVVYRFDKVITPWKRYVLLFCSYMYLLI